MAPLVSNIPLVYCLLYYRTGSQIGQFDRTLSSQFSSSDLETKNIIRLPGRSGQTSSPNVDRSSTEKPWIYHSRMRDLKNVCSHFYGQNMYFNEVPADGSQDCSVKTLKDVRRMFSSSFTSEYDLQNIILRLDVDGTSEKHRRVEHSVARYIARPLAEAELGAEMHGDVHCVSCLTEVGYEVLTEVTDFKGVNHTVINFHNAYQFIPSGRCMNENYLCRGGNARCKQVYRAQWTLVWSSLAGAQLVAHEVPSHCECVNIGGPSPPDIPPSKAAQHFPVRSESSGL